MTRNLTPRPIKASGARDAHGRIMEPSAGALYVHMHRESGLAHRHYVLRPWKVRVLAILVSRPMLLIYFVGVITWGWTAGQAARVPLLRQEIADLQRDAERLDTLKATLEQLQARYDQVQKMLSTATASRLAPGDSSRASRDSTRRSAAGGGR